MSQDCARVSLSQSCRRSCKGLDRIFPFDGLASPRRESTEVAIEGEAISGSLDTGIDIHRPSPFSLKGKSSHSLTNTHTRTHTQTHRHTYTHNPTLTPRSLHGALPLLLLPAVMQSAQPEVGGWEGAGPGEGAEGRGWHI